MAQRVGIYRVQDLININDISYWFSVNDINQNIGTQVTSINSRYGTALTYIQEPNANVFTLVTDSQGFKALQLSNWANNSAFFRNSSHIITANNNETWIVVYQLSAGNQNIAPITKAAPGQLNSGAFNYGSYTTGTGLLPYPSQTGKVILTATITSSLQRVIRGYRTIGTPIVNPDQSILATNDRIFAGSNNAPSDNNIFFYAAIRIQNTYNEITLRRLIRSIAFEHGIIL